MIFKNAFHFSDNATCTPYTVWSVLIVIGMAVSLICPIGAILAMMCCVCYC